MLEWDEGTRDHLFVHFSPYVVLTSSWLSLSCVVISKKWPGFHSAAEGSTGVGKGVKDELKTKCNYEEEKKPEHSDIVKKCIADNMGHYEYLQNFVKTRA
jgi:hypothetical protein